MSIRIKQAQGVAESGCRRAAVIGAGSMGAGIAAQFANAGVPVDLLDVPAADGGRNARAEAGIAAQVKRHGFMGPEPVTLVRAGNVEDDLDRLAEADWIVEAVIENLAIKRDLFARIEAVRKPGALVTSNTSTIPRAELLEGRSADFADHFLISHFFNPPRQMELLELVGTPGGAWDMAAQIGRDVLGKTVIACRDTPGFIANRVGCTWMSVAIVEALRLGLTPEEADAVHTVFGVPRTGVFGLLDLVGIDVVPPIWSSLMSELPEGDAINRFDLPGQPVIRAMIDAGRHGRKTGAGFYRLGEGGAREALDLVTCAYRPQQSVAAKDLPGGGDLAGLLADGGKLGAYARSVLSEVLGYAALHAPEIAAKPGDVDTAMELGYAWREGPFKLLKRVAPIAAGMDGLVLPALPDLGGPAHPAAAGRLALAKAGGAPLAGNASASLWDLGDGVACLEVHTKMNAIDAGVFEVIEATLERVGGPVSALVIGNDNPRAFSAGANLAAVTAMIEAADWAGIEAFIRRGQQLYGALRYAGVPVVAAVRGLALGGGCEMTLHSDHVVAHAEAAIGLPEPTLGLLPAWGGCTRLLERAQARAGAAQDPVATPQAVLDAILAPRPSASAREAMASGLLCGAADIVMHREAVFDVAARRAGALAEGYVPPPPPVFRCAGPSAAEGLMAGLNARNAAGTLSDADLAVAARIAAVLTGGPGAGPGRELTEAELLDLECTAFVAMTQEPLTLVRIRHVLKTGKPMKT